MRAIRLHERSLQDSYSGSPALAGSYVERSLSNISIQKIESKGKRYGTLYEGLVLVGLLGSAFLAVADGHRILEGCNVALSRHGRAPIHMLWLDVDSVSALPPAYLGASEHSLLFGTRVAEPKGTLIRLRGVPIHPGVALILTSGERSVDFEGNAEGEMVARWTVDRPERLRVAARLGQVIVEQDDELIVDADIDAPPTVKLENASRTIRLGQVDRVEVFYRAEDDHGLRQIDLVLKSADREVRRQLMRLDGQQREYQGSHAVAISDPFLKNAHLPIALRIEARDDNSLAENNWGHSDWLTLEPPSPGETEAARLRILDSVRAALIDWLAPEIARKDTGAIPESIDTMTARRAIDRLSLALAQGHGAWEWPKPIELLLRAQREKLEKIASRSSPAVQSLEHAALTVDAALHALAQRDAISVARSLAELADDIAHGAREASYSEKKTSAIRRVDDATRVLTNGSQQLVILGSLGADLSGIIRATLIRLERARKDEDYTHVELAAEYLAARLRRPVPSAALSSGVESGTEAQASPSRSRPTASDADIRIERLLWELKQIKEEHQSGLDYLERTLKGAIADAELDEQRPLAKDRADRLRRFAERLPYLGAEPDSALSSQVVAREQSLGMAESVERLSYGDAMTRGRAARDAVNEAMVRASREANHGNIDEKALRSLRDELVVQLQYLDQVLERSNQRATRAAAGQLRDQVGKERQLAGRANALANREKGSDAVLPESMRRDLERASGLMDQASDSLERSNGDMAYNQEQRAQELLDQFDTKPNQSSAGHDGSDAAHGKSSPTTDRGTVTPTGDPQAAALFRRRVQRGLSQDVPGELGSTIRRYAEGLLR